VSLSEQSVNYFAEFYALVMYMVGGFLTHYSIVVTIYTIYTTRFSIRQFYVLPTQCIYVLCGSENKQRLFPYTTLTDWFV
jgi:hypothetical protein